MNNKPATDPFLNSTQKAHRILEHLAEMDDDEIADAFPVPAPPAMVRGLLAFISPRIPADPAVLDEFLEQVSGFCLSLRSDEPAR